MIIPIFLIGIILLLLFLLWQKSNPVKQFSDPAFLLDASGKLVKMNIAFKQFQTQFFPILKTENAFHEITGKPFNSNCPWKILSYPVKLDSKNQKLTIHPLKSGHFVCVISEDEFSGIQHNILHRLIHNAKGPMATASLALHNLYFITHQKDSLPDLEAIDEFLIPAQEAVEETSRRIQNAVLFSKSEQQKKHVVNINEIVETAYKKIKKSLVIHLLIDKNVDFTLANEKSLILALEELARFSASVNNSQQPVFIKTCRGTSADGKAQTEIHIFPESLSKGPDIPTKNELLNSVILKDNTQPMLNMALIVLEQNQVTVYGYQKPDSGSYFRLIFKNL